MSLIKQSRASGWRMLPTVMAMLAGLGSHHVLAQASDPQAAVPRLTYRSPLAGVRSMADAPVGNWRQANEVVNERGGWKAHARAAQAPEAAASDAPTDAATARPDGHEGHSKSHSHSPPGHQHHHMHQTPEKARP